MNYYLLSNERLDTFKAYTNTKTYRPNMGLRLTDGKKFPVITKTLTAQELADQF